MQDVSKTVGRTIIFVSHNMQAVSNLCNRAIWLSKGKLIMDGKASDVVQDYITSVKPEMVPQTWENSDSAPGNEFIRLKSVHASPLNGESYFTVNTPVLILADFWCYVTEGEINVNVSLNANTGECLFNLGSQSVKAVKSIITLRVLIPANLLNNMLYHLSLTVVKNHSYPICDFPDCAAIDIEDDRKDMYYFGTWPGLIRPQIENNLYIRDNL